MRMQDDKQPVPSNLDGFGRDRFERRKQGDLHGQMFELILLHGSESRIFNRSTAGASSDGFSKRFAGLGYPNAALQVPAHVKGNEYSSALRKDSFARNEVWKFPPRNSIHNGIAR